MPKPRSNHDTCAYWADGILTREPQPSITVNSVQVRGDTVYSFGSHFPMGIIVRDSKGRCVKVLLNADSWPGGGFANTGGDQSSCRMEANDRIAQASWHIELQSVLLTNHGRGNGPVRCKPRDGDPEPPYPHLEVPTYFVRSDPGPEPVKDSHGCLDGRTEEYEYQTDEYVAANLDLYADDQVYVGAFDRLLVPGAWLHRTYGRDGTGGSIHSRRTHVGVIEWGEASYNYGRKSGVTYKQCPHCLAFSQLHARWRQAYHGRGYGQNGHRGYRLYAEMMDTYGSEQEWRDARVRDWARVKEGRRVHAEWHARNHIPFEAVSWAFRHGVRIPNFDSDGYPTRKDQEAHYRAERHRARAEKRRQREAEARERDRIAVEKFKERIRRQRKPTFEQRAAEVAVELAAIAEGLKVSVTINDSSEERIT